MNSLLIFFCSMLIFFSSYTISIFAETQPLNTDPNTSINSKVISTVKLKEDLKLPEPTQVLDKLWETLKENYPMMEYAGACDESWHEEFKEKIKGMEDIKKALPILEQLVNRLHDYHTKLSWEGKPVLKTPPVRLGIVENQVVVIEREESLPVSNGDIVKQIDGKDTLETFREMLPFTKGATKYAKNRNACKKLISGEPNSNIRITFENPDKGEYELTLKRSGGVKLTDEKNLSSRKLNHDIGYIMIRQWFGFAPAEFDNRLQKLRNLPYLIIDVRENGGGSDRLAEQVIGRFIEKAVVCSISFKREEGTDMYKKRILTAVPRGPWQYEGVVVVLINEGCCSATGHFVSGMYEAGAILVGTPTTGACGLSKSHDLGHGIILKCSATFPLHGKVPSPLHGIEPHVLALPTLEDIRNGRDTALRTACDILSKKEYEKLR